MDKNQQNPKLSEHQQHYTYNKKLLENMSTLLNYVESSRQDLLSATKALLTAYKSEFEDGKSLQDDIVKLTQHNLELENARDKVETDLLRLREAYNRELVKNEELMQRLQTNEFGLRQNDSRMVQNSAQLSSEQKQGLSLATGELTKLNSVNQTTELSMRSPISAFSSRVSDSINPEASVAFRRLSLPRRLNSSTLSYSNLAPNSTGLSTHYSTATIHTHVSDKKQEHNFTETNKMSFNSCFICKKSIIPLVKYFHCLNCDIKIDKNCFSKNVSIPCQSGIKKSIKLQDLPIQKCTKPHISELIVKCCQQIEQKGTGTTGLYQNLKEKEASKLLDRYFLESNVDILKLHKQNVHVLCSMIILVFNRLDESLITRKLWQDFALACGHNSSQECEELMQLSIDKLDMLNRQTLAYFILHLRKLSTKNFGNNLNNQTLASIFGPVIVKDDGHLLSARKSSATLKDNMKLFNIQNQIMQSLLDIGTERWQQILAANRDTAHSTNQTRRKTTNFRDVLVADKMRVSFYEKLSTSMY